MSSFSRMHGFEGNPLKSFFSQRPSIGVTGSHFTLFVHEDDDGVRAPESNNFLVTVKALAKPVSVARIVRHDEGVTEEDIKNWMVNDGRASARGMKAIYTAERDQFVHSEIDPQSKEGRFRQQLADRARYQY